MDNKKAYLLGVDHALLFLYDSFPPENKQTFYNFSVAIKRQLERQYDLLEKVMQYEEKKKTNARTEVEKSISKHAKEMRGR